MNRTGAIGFAAIALLLTAGTPHMASVRADPLAPRPISSAIYAGSASGHIYRSATGTSHWQESDHGVPAGSDITALAVTPNGGTVYAATWGSGLYVSADGGMHWRNAGGPHTNLGVNYISGLALDPEHSQTVYAVTSDDRFHVGTDAGAHWDSTLLPVDLIDSVTTTSLSVSRNDPALMLVGTELEGIVRSSDVGRTWSDTNLSTNLSVNALTFSPRSANVAYAATDKGIYQTVDSGISWQLERHGIAAGTQFQAIAVDPGNAALVLAGTPDGQFYRSR
ncbi:MAG: WD40/YVTN/BNR-like repeat-containing protein, partial [Chloroflexota bacterium]